MKKGQIIDIPGSYVITYKGKQHFVDHLEILQITTDDVITAMYQNLVSDKQESNQLLKRELIAFLFFSLNLATLQQFLSSYQIFAINNVPRSKLP